MDNSRTKTLVFPPVHARDAKGSLLLSIRGQHGDALGDLHNGLACAYVVCGLSATPDRWKESGIRQVRDRRKKPPGFTRRCGIYEPEILNTIPTFKPGALMNSLGEEVKNACFPQDAEVVASKVRPPATCHAFTLQSLPQTVLHGVCLRVWAKLGAPDSRPHTRTGSEGTASENASVDNPSLTNIQWVPLGLVLLSKHSLYDLLGDYLRCMWRHMDRRGDIMHPDEIQRILDCPDPQPHDIVYITMGPYEFYYEMPSRLERIRNYALWPLFACLSPANIIAILELAVCPLRRGRIIFVSKHLAMLTVAAETIRHCARRFAWSGLFQPVVAAHSAPFLFSEPGPYLVGTQAPLACKPPPDALVVDLDRDMVRTQVFPNTFPDRVRLRLLNRLTAACEDRPPASGVPEYLRAAYRHGSFTPAGNVLSKDDRIASIKAPAWWNAEAVLEAVDELSELAAGATARQRVAFPFRPRHSVEHQPLLTAAASLRSSGASSDDSDVIRPIPMGPSGLRIPEPIEMSFTAPGPGFACM